MLEWTECEQIDTFVKNVPTGEFFKGNWKAAKSSQIVCAGATHQPCNRTFLSTCDAENQYCWGDGTNGDETKGLVLDILTQNPAFFRKMRIGARKSKMTFCGENRKLHFVQSVKCAQNMQIFQRKNKRLFLMKQVVTQLSATVSCLLNRNLHGNWCSICDWFGNVEWIGQFETRTTEAKMCVRKNIFGQFSSFWSMFSIKMAL